MLLATDGWSHNELQLPFGVLWPAARLRKLHGNQTTLRSFLVNNYAGYGQ